MPNVFSKQTLAEEFSEIQELHFLHEDVRIMFMMINEEAKTNETLKVIWKKRSFCVFFCPRFVTYMRRAFLASKC